jgi:hypothetical protein
MLLQQPSCRLQYATIGLQMLLLQIALCHNQMQMPLVMKSKRGKDSMKPLWHNGDEVPSGRDPHKNPYKGVCHTVALPYIF